MIKISFGLTARYYLCTTGKPLLPASFNQLLTSNQSVFYAIC